MTSKQKSLNSMHRQKKEIIRHIIHNIKPNNQYSTILFMSWKHMKWRTVEVHMFIMTVLSNVMVFNVQKNVLICCPAVIPVFL